MKLTDLHPKYAGTNGTRTHVIFDCPKCLDHSISVRISPIENDKNRYVWTAEGELENLTLSPSVDMHPRPETQHVYAGECNAHFHVRNGEIIML